MVAVMDMMFLIGQSRFSVITLIAPVRTKGHPAAMCDYSTKDASPSHSGSSYSWRKSPCSHGHGDAVRPNCLRTTPRPKTHGDLPIPWPVSRYPWLRASHCLSSIHSVSALHLLFLLFQWGCWSPHVLLQIRGVTSGWLRGLNCAAASPTAKRLLLDT